jgi:hypothetical protein
MIAFVFTSWKLNLHLLIPEIEFTVPDKPKKERKKIQVKVPTISKKEESKEDILKEDENKKVEDTSILKTMFKEKIKKKIQEKEEKTIIVNYPKDKPTFSVKELEHGNNDEYTIDDKILIQQAQDIKSKLEEFNIPVEIA